MLPRVGEAGARESNGYAFATAFVAPNPAPPSPSPFVSEPAGRAPHTPKIGRPSSFTPLPERFNPMTDKER